MLPEHPGAQDTTLHLLKPMSHQGGRRRRSRCSLLTSNASLDWIACDYEGRTERVMSSTSQRQPKTSANSQSSSRRRCSNRREGKYISARHHHGNAVARSRRAFFNGTGALQPAGGTELRCTDATPTIPAGRLARSYSVCYRIHYGGDHGRSKDCPFPDRSRFAR